MPQDRMTALFFELFAGLPRQGPGDAASTRRALALIPGLGPEARVLDIGCGTGAQTLTLARSSPARIVAVDNHEPFVAELSRQVQAFGFAGRVQAVVGDMYRLGLAPESFDVIWCEGAISVIGVEAGLREWRRLLVPGGHLAFTEVCWTRPDPPAACVAFWQQEYPAIRHPAEILELIETCGYDSVRPFALPSSSWWDDYYRPLQQNVREFLERHGGEHDAGELADRVRREIDVWHAYSEFYGYEFFVVRRR